MWKKRRNILHFALVFFVSTEINFEGLGHGREGADSTGEGRRRQEGTDGAWISVPVSGNGFSKYSVETIVAGRNHPRSAIQAHCGLLVTSMKDRCMSFDNHIRLSAPSEAFKENIKIVETEEDTIITIKGKYINEK